QRVDQGTKAQPTRALRHRRKKHARGGSHAERRGMMLGEVVAADAEPIVGPNELQPLPLVGAEGRRAEVKWVEDASLHGPCSVSDARLPGNPRGPSGAICESRGQGTMLFPGRIRERAPKTRQAGRL